MDFLNCGVAHQLKYSDVREGVTGIEPATAELQLFMRATVSEGNACVISAKIRKLTTTNFVTHVILDKISY